MDSALAWGLEAAIQAAAGAHRVARLQRFTGPLLRRLHGRLTRVQKARYGKRFPGVEIVHYGRTTLAGQREAGYQSQGGQDFFVHQALLRDRREGFYVDVGANDPRRFSNTWFFDQRLAWRGLAIEPIARYQQRWRAERSAEVVPCIASEREGVVEFDEVSGDEHADALSSVTGASAKHAGYQAVRRTVQARPLAAVLAERGIRHVDLMSIDVEGHEPDVLRGMDFGAVTVDVVLIENNVPPLWGSDWIRGHMAGNGFAHVARIWQLDDVFVRRGALPHPGAVAAAAP